MKRKDYTGFLFRRRHQRSGLMSMTNSAINSLCDIPYFPTLFVFPWNTAGVHIMTKINPSSCHVLAIITFQQYLEVQHDNMKSDNRKHNILQRMGEPASATHIHTYTYMYMIYMYILHKVCFTSRSSSYVSCVCCSRALHSHLPVFGKITGFSSLHQLLCRVTVWEEGMKGRNLNVSDTSSTSSSDSLRELWVTHRQARYKNMYLDYRNMPRHHV